MLAGFLGSVISSLAVGVSISSGMVTRNTSPSPPIRVESHIDSPEAAAARAPWNQLMAEAMLDNAKIEGRPKAYLTLEHPPSFRVGDEVHMRLGLDLASMKPVGLLLQISSSDLVIKPADRRLAVDGFYSDTLYPILASPTAGRKSITVSVQDEKTGRNIDSITTSLDVLPPLSVLGIPKPYLDVFVSLAGTFGLPALIASLLTYFLATRKASTETLPPPTTAL